MSTTPSAEAPALLTVAELADRILRRPDPESEAARHAVWKLCRQGLPYVRAAGARLFSAAACIAWLERKAEAEAAARRQSAELAAMVAQAAAAGRGRAPRRTPATIERPGKGSKGAPPTTLSGLAGRIRNER